MFAISLIYCCLAFWSKELFASARHAFWEDGNSGAFVVQLISFGSMSCVQTGSVVHGGLLLNPGLQCHFVAWHIYSHLQESKVHVLVSLFDRSNLSKKDANDVFQNHWFKARPKDVNSCQKPACKKNSMAKVAIHRLPLGPWVALGWKFRHSELAIHSLTRGAISVCIKNKS